MTISLRISITAKLTMNSFSLVILNVVIFTSVLPVSSLRNATVIDGEDASAYQTGDVILGGLFPTHLSQRGRCGELDMESVVLVEAMIYTVNRVNEESLLPWNLTLGYDIRDTCNVVPVALKRALNFLSEKRYSITDDNMKRCGSNGRQTCEGKLISVIGAGSSEISVAINKVLSVFEIPQIGYASTSGILSDKTRFPSFSRTVVPGSQRPKVMLKIMAHFGWTYVALLTSNDPHWKSLSLEFKNLAHSQGVCIGVDELVPHNTSIKEMQSIIHRLQSKEKLHVILLFTSPLDTNNIIIEASIANMTGKVWVASEALPGSARIIREHARVSQGMLVIANKLESVADFSKYFENLTPKATRNPWLGKLWEKNFGCSFGKDVKTCMGIKKDNGILQTLSFSHVNHVIDAVMAVCHVVKRICSESVKANATRGREKCLNDLTKPKVLSQMFLGPFVFQSLSNRTVFLDSNGDAVSSYKIQNLQRFGNGVGFSTVGSYTGNTLDIEEGKVQWPNTKKPNGRCSLPCNKGSYRIYKDSRCCWRCGKCPVGSISRDAIKCTTCQKGYTSNDDRTICRQITHAFFGWDTAEAGVVISLSLVCFALSLTVYVVLLKNNNTPIVSGLGSETNFRLIWSIIVGVLVPFAYIGYPTDSMCKIQTVLFGTSLTFTMSLVLAKAKQVTCKRKNLVSKWRVMIYSRSQMVFSLFLTIVELLICILWIINKPPSAQVRNISPDKAIVICTNTTSSWYVLSTFHILVISIVCTYLSYNYRKRLVNYSETKYILYSLIAFYSFWIIFTAARYGSPVGVHDVMINCLAIITSQMIFLSFIYCPKLFIILFKSRLNKDAVFYALIAADDEIECACANSKQRIEGRDHPHGSSRPPSLSLRDVSSREFSSEVSLESKSYPRAPYLKKLSTLPCCSCLPHDNTSTADFPDSRGHVNQRLYVSSRPLPVISIEEGSGSQTSRLRCHVREDADIISSSDRCTCELNSVEDHEYQAENIVSLTAGGMKSKIWNKRPSKNGKKRSQADSESTCDKVEGPRTSRFIMKAVDIEGLQLEGSAISNEHSNICESRL